MSDGLQLQSIALPDVADLIALPDVADLQAATIPAAAAQCPAADCGSDSDWSVNSACSLTASAFPQPHPQLRSDDGANGHGPPLRASIIAPALAYSQTDHAEDRGATPDAAAASASSAAAAAAASDDDDFEPAQRPFSAAIQAHVSRTVTSTNSDSGDDDRDGSAVTQSGSFLSDADSSAAVDSSSLILKRGWLRKLARFGRDMKRCDHATNPTGLNRFMGAAQASSNACFSFFVVAPLDPVRMLPLLQPSDQLSGQRGYAVFYYKDEPHNLLQSVPHGIITLSPTTTVEPYSDGSKHLFCVRVSSAQQLVRRLTSKDT
jgi:hypothetical protein